MASETWPPGPGRLIRPQRASGELRRIIAAFDPDRVEANIRKLVSFGTRHTLSVQDDPNRGIGAARDWIAAEMTKYAAESGGRMTVTVPSYIHSPGRTILGSTYRPDQQRRRDPEGECRPEPHLRHHRPLRLARHRRDEPDRGRTGRERRRVGHGRDHGAGSRRWHPPAGLHADLRGRRGGGAGPLRLDVPGAAAQGCRCRRPGHVHQRHRREQPRRRRDSRPVQPATVRAGTSRDGGRREPPSGSRSAARTTRPRASSPGSSPRSPDLRRRG